MGTHITTGYVLPSETAPWGGLISDAPHPSYRLSIKLVWQRNGYSILFDTNDFPFLSSLRIPWPIYSHLLFPSKKLCSTVSSPGFIKLF